MRVLHMFLISADLRKTPPEGLRIKRSRVRVTPGALYFQWLSGGSAVVLSHQSPVVPVAVPLFCCCPFWFLLLSIIQKRIFLNTRRNICHQHHRFGLPKHFLQPFGPVIIGVLSPNLITYKNPCYNIFPFSHPSRIFSFSSLPEGIPVSIFATASVQKNTFSHDRQQRYRDTDF